MEVPRLGVELELQVPAYTAGTQQCHIWAVSATYPHSSQQCRILNTLKEAKDQTRILMTLCWILNPLNHSGNS